MSLLAEGMTLSEFFFEDLPTYARDMTFLRRDVFVFGKAFVDFSALIRGIHDHSHAKVLIDICDNVFAPPEDGLKSVYVAMLPHTDAVLTSSEFLSQTLQDKVRSGVQLFSIPDAVEGHRIDPDFKPRPGSIRLLWFGYRNNLPLLENELPNLSKLTQIAEVRLSIVSDWDTQTTFPSVIGGIRIRCLQWSPKVMRDELKACDFVVVPSDDSPARLTKSANRIITAIWAGKFVVATPLPSFRSFEQFAHIDRDLVAGVRWALKNRGATRERISAGQQFIQKHYAIERIADAWERTLALITGHPGPAN